MMRSLWSAASGMMGQQFNVDVISNNLANVNTTGFKRARADFEDLMYQKLMIPGTTAAQGTQIPTGTEVGLGTRVAATSRMNMQGSLKHTENPLDLAIEGEGYFQITMPDGTLGYTRDGSFKLEGTGAIVNSDGYRLADNITIPADATNVSVADDGTVSVLVAGQATPQDVGQIQIAKFVNPAGLSSMGANILVQTPASGDPVLANPGSEGTGRLRHGYLEMSNVAVVEAMVDLITAQRAYEVNSKSIQTADNMLGVAANLKR